jgi:hypothetical protein
MRISSYAVARPAYYDRNATSGLSTYGAVNIGPHAETVRFTVTVGSGRKAFIEQARFTCLRITAAAVVNATTMIFRNTSGASSVDLIYETKWVTTVGDELTQGTTGTSTLYAGETLDARTSDLCTGGAWNYYLNCKYTTFDA